jgi:hypothetical protein
MPPPLRCNAAYLNSIHAMFVERLKAALAAPL